MLKNKFFKRLAAIMVSSTLLLTAQVSQFAASEHNLDEKAKDKAIRVLKKIQYTDDEIQSLPDSQLAIFAALEEKEIGKPQCTKIYYRITQEIGPDGKVISNKEVIPEETAIKESTEAKKNKLNNSQTSTSTIGSGISIQSVLRSNSWMQI